MLSLRLHDALRFAGANDLQPSSIIQTVSETNANLIALLRSTLVGMEDEASSSTQDAGVSDLKRSVIRAVADLEIRKLDSERFEHAAEIASILARAGRATYVVHPATTAMDFAEAPVTSAPECFDRSSGDLVSE